MTPEPARVDSFSTYQDFLGLSVSPFELSPDPFFMFSSEKSRDALASISHAVHLRKGFVVMTGEVGTGKTLLLRCLFEYWEREQIPFVYFIGPRLSTIDFLRYVAFELGIEVAEPTKGNLLRALYGFLLAQFERGLTTVLVIDEAHQIPGSVLEEVRILANFETAQQKLIQILLVGQPELEKKLDTVELRSLKQRIAVRCQLEPLSADEIRRYIEHRLELAGAKSQANTIFPAETIQAILRYSQGIPRLVNSICDQALVVACARQVRVVPVDVIEQVASRFRLDATPSPKRTERPISITGQMEMPVRDRFLEPARDRSLERVRPSDAPAGEASDPDTILRHRNGVLGGFAQTQIPPSNAKTTRLFEDPAPTKRRLNRKTIVAVVVAVAIVAVILATSVILAVHAKGAVKAPNHATSGSESPPVGQAPGLATASTQPPEVGFATQFDTGSVTPTEPTTGSGTSQPAGALKDLNPRTAAVVGPLASSATSEPAAAPKDLNPRTTIVTGRLSRPVLPMTHLSTSADPPPTVGTQTKELESGKGLLDISVPNPAPPVATNGGHLQPPRLLSSPPPIYPMAAQEARVHGVVVIDALVDVTGKVVEMTVISGPHELTQAAMDDLRKWQYEPARLNGEVIPTHVKVSINFNLR